MSLIKVLSENLVNQIAAGEVVERPASVVKELVENSLDAGACNIVVEIKDSGKALIRVSDNGFGMSREDCQLALQRHATSKLLNEAGLWNIKTMGFRGEALASISSVSQLTLKSKREEDLAGTEINAYAGEIKTVGDVGMSTGTSVEVRSLFFNTPARQKYLKKEATELGHIDSALTTIALANPNVAFKLINNGKTVLDLPRTTDLISRIADVFGVATSEAMIPVFYGGSEFHLEGFVGKPVIARSGSQHQYIFVNKRPIQHFILANTVREAFHSLLMENKKPVFVLNIEIDPALIDVNVHPRKLEIRFENQQILIQKTYSAVKSALEKTNLTPTLGQSYGRTVLKREVQSLFTGREFHSIVKQDSPRIGQSLMKALSQVANSYIVAQKEDSIVLIDQHAAHERIRYEQLMDQLQNDKKSIQPLLVPYQLELTTSEIALIEEQKELFINLGFEIEGFGGKTFVINTAPSFLAKEDLDSVIKGVIDDVLAEKSPSKLQGKTETIINYMACRSAVKFGQKMAPDEMETLIVQLEKLKRPYTCPHGRPTMIDLSLGELEKMFGRK